MTIPLINAKDLYDILNNKNVWNKKHQNTIILSFLKRERERDFANVSDRLSCTV
jgi:hypothetical protein